jgi:hypothetical protein
MREAAHETEVDVCVRVPLAEIVLSMWRRIMVGPAPLGSAAMGVPRF